MTTLLPIQGGYERSMPANMEKEDLKSRLYIMISFLHHTALLTTAIRLITITYCQYANCVLGQENYWQYGKSSHLESNHMGAWSKNVYVSQSVSNLQIPHSKIDYNPQHHSLMPWPCPLADKEKGLVTIEWFLGCVNSAVLILYKHWLHACMAYTYFTGTLALFN